MNTTTRKNLGLLALIGLLGALPACTAAPKDPVTESNVDKHNKVNLVRLTHDIDFGSAGLETKALPDASARALDAFLKNSRIGQYDELSLDIPQTKDGDISKLDLSRRKTLAAYLATRGLTLATIITPYGAEPHPGTLRLVVGRYVVTRPACADWSKPAGALTVPLHYVAGDKKPYTENAVSSNYGCATESTLGMMVANPHDLVEGRDLEGNDGAVGAKAVQNFNEGHGDTTAGSGGGGQSSSTGGGASTGMTTTGN